MPGVIKGIRLADDGSPELSVVIDSGIIITAGLGEVRLPNARQLIEQAHRVKQVAERPVASASRSPAHRKPQTNRGTGPASREPGDILVVDHQGSLQAVVPAKAAQVAAREAAAWRAAEGIPDVTRD